MSCVCLIVCLSIFSLVRILDIASHHITSHEQVRGISSVERLSVTQLNSEEPFVASVTLVAEAGGGDGGGHKIGGLGLLAAGSGGLGLAESVKRVLAGHNIGRNTVEIVLPAAAAADGAAGSLGKRANGDSAYPYRGAVDVSVSVSSSSAVEAHSDSDGTHDEGERGHAHHGGSGGEGSGGNSHGGHSHGHGHGQCSGHGHSHGHAATVEVV